MKVGLFLDVDGVLTEEPVNLQYAKMLGLKKQHAKLEQRFEDKKITSREFGERLVAAFRKKKFTAERATELYRNLEYRNYSEELLGIFNDVYIVSSAPSYFIDEIQKQYSIPEDRVLCSKYEFDDKGLIKRCAKPVDHVMKADFVKDVKEQYNIRIGVGDFPQQDRDFMALCDIQILMRHVKEIPSGYLCVDKLQPINSFLTNLKRCTTFTESAIVDSDKFAAINKASEKLLAESPYEKNVFIMTPYREDVRYQLMEQTIRLELQTKGFHGWFAKDKVLHPELWANTQAFMLSCQYGIAVFTASEEQEGDIIQPRERVYNPNVSIELGFMLSRGKEVLILKDKRYKTLMTDMGGALYDNLNLENPQDLSLIIQKWVDERLVKK